jgi:hypothetical protein
MPEINNLREEGFILVTVSDHHSREGVAKQSSSHHSGRERKCLCFWSFSISPLLFCLGHQPMGRCLPLPGQIFSWLILSENALTDTPRGVLFFFLLGTSQSNQVVKIKHDNAIPQLGVVSFLALRGCESFLDFLGFDA